MLASGGLRGWRRVSAARSRGRRGGQWLRCICCFVLCGFWCLLRFLDRPEFAAGFDFLPLPAFLLFAGFLLIDSLNVGRLSTDAAGDAAVRVRPILILLLLPFLAPYRRRLQQTLALEASLLVEGLKVQALLLPARLGLLPTSRLPGLQQAPVHLQPEHEGHGARIVSQGALQQFIVAAAHGAVVAPPVEVRVLRAALLLHELALQRNVLLTLPSTRAVSQ